VLVARYNALELTGREARRRPVYACRVERGQVVSAEIAPTPAEVLELPLTRRAAVVWLLEHFEDLEPGARREALAALTALRPLTGAAEG
jgi:hypothetical protein